MSRGEDKSKRQEREMKTDTTITKKTKKRLRGLKLHSNSPATRDSEADTNQETGHGNKERRWGRRAAYKKGQGK